jgi:MoxR-like ATPase
MGKAIMLTGPAGTGKNYLIEQIATALGGKFFYSSTITQEYKLTGFIDASGNYHSTELRKAIDYANEHPDIKVIMMIDEIDASVPDTLVVANSLLANRYFDFPDQRVSVGDNFVIIAAGNTVGLGADMVYTGRNVIDGATLDRFILVKMDYDSELENALCPEESLKNFIYDIRKSAKKNHINCIVGMRCLKNAYEMFVNEFDKQDIVSDAIIKGLGEDDINVLKADLDSSNEWYKYFKYVA